MRPVRPLSTQPGIRRAARCRPVAHTGSRRRAAICCNLSTPSWWTTSSNAAGGRACRAGASRWRRPDGRSLLRIDRRPTLHSVADRHTPPRPAAHSQSSVGAGPRAVTSDYLRPISVPTSASTAHLRRLAPGSELRRPPRPEWRQPTWMTTALNSRAADSVRWPKALNPHARRDVSAGQRPARWGGWDSNLNR